MSLKGFHIAFIVAATLLASLFGGWAVVRFAEGDGGFYLASAIGGGLAAVALVVYGVWFIRKLRDVSSL